MRMSNQSHQIEQTSCIPQPDYERTPIRLTKRGRRVLGALSVLVAGATLLGATKIIDAATPDVTFSDSTITRVVEEGDSVWHMAEQIEGIDTIDVRTAVEHIEQTNPGLADGLQVGEDVVVPTAVESVDE